MDKRYSLSAFIGETINGFAEQSVEPYPVLFDTHYAPLVLNKPPCTMITGSPGSGKTFFGMLLAAIASIRMETGIIFDPKGDFPNLKSLEYANESNQIQIWSVMSTDGVVAKEDEGMLDPTVFTDNADSNNAITIDIIRLLIGNLTSRQFTVLSPIVADVTCKPETASFKKVVDNLIRFDDDEVREVGFALDLVLKNPLSKLLVKNKHSTRQRIDIVNKITVASLIGLELPIETKKKEDYTIAEKISVCIMGLFSQLALSMMKEIPVTKRKLLLIDEAWAIVATRSGVSMIKECARLGRSLNLAVVLLSQSSTHITGKDNEDLKNTISTRFAFRNSSVEDNLITIRDMKLPEGEGWEQRLAGISTGQCLMQDCRDQKGWVHIMVKDEWKDLFSTNPLDRLRREKEKGA